LRLFRAFAAQRKSTDYFSGTAVCFVVGYISFHLCIEINV